MNNSPAGKTVLTKACVRYIVPFKIIPEQPELNSAKKTGAVPHKQDSYELILKCLNESDRWTQIRACDEFATRNTSATRQDESCFDPILKSELYTHILKTLSVNCESADCQDYSIGSSWEYVPLRNEALRPDIRCTVKKAVRQSQDVSENIPTDVTFRFSINRAGLFAFRTEIGLFWFEINADENGECSPFSDIRDFTLFQKCMKELSAPWQKDMYELHNGGDSGTSAKFIMGEWISDILNSLMSSDGGNILKAEYYSSRVIDGNKNKKITVPDKAILFNLAVMKPEHDYYYEKVRRDLTSTAFLLSNGFTDNYLMPENFEGNVLRPFANVVWHASSFGVGQYVITDDSNAFFFEKIMPARMMSDYFIIYIILLYQHYSIQFYTEKLELTFPANLEKISLDTLLNYSEKINLFLIKSVYASVSHLEQHNNVYRHISEKLCIRENISCLTIGLDSLSEIIRNKNNDAEATHEKNITNSLNSLALVVIASALTDTYAFLNNDVPDLINGLLEGNYLPTDNQPYIWFVVKGMFVAILTVLFVRVLWGMHMRQRIRRNKIPAAGKKRIKK